MSSSSAVYMRGLSFVIVRSKKITAAYAAVIFII